MIFLKRYFSIILIGILFPLSGSSCDANKQSHFDYYVLALSWSPAYCQKHSHEKEQCNKRVPYRFILHGLWPNNENGTNPAFCYTDRKLDEDLITRMLAIMPSKKLIEHEWKKHGTCSGLSAADYFKLSKDLFERVKVPDNFMKAQSVFVEESQQIKKDFIQKNTSWKYDGLRVINKSKNFIELRVCLSKSLTGRACPFPITTDPTTKLSILPPNVPVTLQGKN